MGVSGCVCSECRLGYMGWDWIGVCRYDVSVLEWIDWMCLGLEWIELTMFCLGWI